MFDSSVAKGREPLEFQLGKGKVIKGKPASQRVLGKN